MTNKSIIVNFNRLFTVITSIFNDCDSGRGIAQSYNCLSSSVITNQLLSIINNQYSLTLQVQVLLMFTRMRVISKGLRTEGTR